MPSTERVIEAYRHVFSSEDGKLVLRDLMHAHYVQEPLPIDNLAYAEGQRNVVLRILALIQKPLTDGV